MTFYRKSDNAPFEIEGIIVPQGNPTLPLPYQQQVLLSQPPLTVGIDDRGNYYTQIDTPLGPSITKVDGYMVRDPLGFFAIDSGKLLSDYSPTLP